MRRMAFMGMVLLLAVGRMEAQTEPVKAAPMAANADPSFDVATVKPSDPEARGRALNLNGRTFLAKNFTLNELIVFGYGVHARQVSGTSGWMLTERFDVTGVPDAEGQPNNQQWRAMVRKMLEGRFQVASHHEERELDVYRLSVAKSGPKMARNESGKPGPGMFNIRITHAGMVMACKNEAMDELVVTMALVAVDRPVLNATGLAGRYDFALTFAPDGAQFAGMNPPPAVEGPGAPSLFTAMQDDLGLKLEAVKAPMDAVVIDHAGRPTEN